MDREQLIDLLKNIYSSQASEKEIDALVNKFLENVPDPSALNYMYAKEYEDLTPEQVVDKALEYKPFYL